MLFKYLTKQFYINFTVIISIILVDRISKIFVVDWNKKNEGQDLYSSEFLNINLIWNEGIAFGLLSFDRINLYNILTSIISIVILIIFIMILRTKGIKKYSLCMIFGGAIGNLIDRIYYRAVPDFFDFHVGNFHWFIFNVADIFISLGVIFMILSELIGNTKVRE
ncbi:MAG: signal peptidase II [Alphaproteobacteria bacterium]|nr:signal peptidase II [Alphaproteobacteria bacterium]